MGRTSSQFGFCLERGISLKISDPWTTLPWYLKRKFLFLSDIEKFYDERNRVNTCTFRVCPLSVLE